MAAHKTFLLVALTILVELLVTANGAHEQRTSAELSLVQLQEQLDRYQEALTFKSNRTTAAADNLALLAHNVLHHAQQYSREVVRDATQPAYPVDECAPPSFFTKGFRLAKKAELASKYFCFVPSGEEHCLVWNCETGSDGQPHYGDFPYDALPNHCIFFPTGNKKEACRVDKKCPGE